MRPRAFNRFSMKSLASAGEFFPMHWRADMVAMVAVTWVSSSVVEALKDASWTSLIPGHLCFIVFRPGLHFNQKLNIASCGQLAVQGDDTGLNALEKFNEPGLAWHLQAISLNAATP